MSGPDIFISYSREDSSAARHFADSFTDEGFTVWWDAALHSGETFDEVIESELRAAKAVVVLWSPRSVASRWVRAEATLADRRHKLAPVLIEPCDRPIIFELTHTADLSNWDGDTSDRDWRNFIKDLHRLVDKGRASVAATGAMSTPPAGPSVAQRFAPRRDERALFRGREARDPRPAERRDVAAPAAAIEARASKVHCLELTIGERLEKRFIVGPPGLKIGRAPPADIILSDAQVSRSHCRVELADGRLQVIDLGSTNGTFVDERRVAGPSVLAIGSVLRVGNVSLHHQLRTRAEV